MTPEDACRTEARRIAELYFPRSRINRQALENDIFLALMRAAEACFTAGLERAPKKSAAIRISPQRED